MQSRGMLDTHALSSAARVTVSEAEEGQGQSLGASQTMQESDFILSVMRSFGGFSAGQK